MKKTEKNFLIILTSIALTFASLSLSSCKQNKDSDGVKVLCTVFPIYDWVINITKDCEGISASLLVDNGTDLHSYQPSFEDMAEIKQSDVVIYVGGESDKWVEDSLDKATTAIKLSDIEGISLCSISSENLASDHSHESEHEHTESFDEHLWLSLNNAITSCKYISETLESIDATNADAYKANAQSYVDKLTKTNEKLSQICKNATAPVVFADRFPFVYLFDDYNIKYYAAFEGCSTDTNADFDTVITLAQKLDEYESKYVLTTESPIPALAQKAIDESKLKSAQILSLDSMQAITAKDIEQGTSYLAIMEQNASILQKLFETRN